MRRPDRVLFSFLVLGEVVFGTWSVIAIDSSAASAFALVVPVGIDRAGGRGTRGMLGLCNSPRKSVRNLAFYQYLIPFSPHR